MKPEFENAAEVLHGEGDVSFLSLTSPVALYDICIIQYYEPLGQLSPASSVAARQLHGALQDVSVPE